MDITTYSTFQSFKPHFDALAKVGYFKLVTNSSSLTRIRGQNVLRALNWVLVLAFNVQQVIKVIQVMKGCF